MSGDDVTMTMAQLQTVLRLAKADAWDEAHVDGCEYVIDAKCRQFHHNPYRGADR